MSGKAEFKNAGEYFDAQNENVRRMLLELKECILQAEPNATELLNYRRCCMNR
jgi:hypothetical protein